MSFLVYSEDRELAFQILAKARELADVKGSEVFALVTEGAPQEYINQGADRALTVEGLGGFALAPYRAAMLKAVEEVDPVRRDAITKHSLVKDGVIVSIFDSLFHTPSLFGETT